jgi:hypothetical protein
VQNVGESDHCLTEFGKTEETNVGLFDSRSESRLYCSLLVLFSFSRHVQYCALKQNTAGFYFFPNSTMKGTVND